MKRQAKAMRRSGSRWRLWLEARLEIGLEMTLAAVGLGTNLESNLNGVRRDRTANLRLAVERVGERLGRVVRLSSFYDTTPVGYVDQPRFLNGAFLLETELGAVELLRGLLEVELGMGRDRRAPVALGDFKGPRTIDLDLLLFGGLILDSPELRLPHPAMWTRRFVLEPLAEIAPGATDPATGMTVEQRWRELLDGQRSVADSLYG